VNGQSYITVRVCEYRYITCSHLTTPYSALLESKKTPSTTGVPVERDKRDVIKKNKHKHKTGNWLIQKSPPRHLGKPVVLPNLHKTRSHLTGSPPSKANKAVHEFRTPRRTARGGPVRSGALGSHPAGPLDLRNTGSGIPRYSHPYFPSMWVHVSSCHGKLPLGETLPLEAPPEVTDTVRKRAQDEFDEVVARGVACRRSDSTHLIPVPIEEGTCGR